MNILLILAIFWPALAGLVIFLYSDNKHGIKFKSSNIIYKSYNILIVIYS